MIRRVFAVIICLPMLMLSSCNPGDVCGPDMIIDCSGACVDEFDVNDSLGDDMCDENLNCSEFNHDGGDCDDNESTTTTTAVTPTPTTTTIDEATTTTTVPDQGEYCCICFGIAGKEGTYEIECCVADMQRQCSTSTRYDSIEECLESGPRRSACESQSTTTTVGNQADYCCCCFGFEEKRMSCIDRRCTETALCDADEQAHCSTSTRYDSIEECLESGPRRSACESQDDPDY